MKKVNVWGLICLLMISIFTFTSCSDNDGGVEDVDLIYGIWEPVRAQGYEIDGGEKYDWDYNVSDVNDDSEIEADYNRFGFFEDNTCTSWWYAGDGEWKVESEGWSFRIDGNQLYMGGVYVNILTLNSTTLVLETHEVGRDYEYYDKVTFKRVE